VSVCAASAGGLSHCEVFDGIASKDTTGRTILAEFNITLLLCLVVLTFATTRRHNSNNLTPLQVAFVIVGGAATTGGLFNPALGVAFLTVGRGAACLLVPSIFAFLLTPLVAALVAAGIFLAWNRAEYRKATLGVNGAPGESDELIPSMEYA
jgi:glycerol uptake facilitator-like aquaporin